MTQVLAWQDAPNSQNIVEQATRALESGQLVAFPTETVYGVAASASHPEVVRKLTEVKGRPKGKPLSLALGEREEAMEWVPRMSRLGRRLAKRCWPGPVTLIFGDLEGGRTSQLAEEVRRLLCPENTLGLRVPAHAAILQTLRLLRVPVVLTSANLSGGPAAVTADGVTAALGNEVALVIDDGRCRFGKPSTVVGVEGECWQILREGPLPTAEIERLACQVILFVCTGNTCRSPMAEALCKMLLAQRLGCQTQELQARGFCVLSAGLSVMMGASAAPEAVQAADEHGADLHSHASRRLSARLLDQADHVIVMTRGHLESITTLFGGLGPMPRLLAPAGEDVDDPIGEDQPVYDECARLIRGHLEARLPEFVVP